MILACCGYGLHVVKVVVSSFVIMEVKQDAGSVYNVNHSNLR